MQIIKKLENNTYLKYLLLFIGAVATTYYFNSYNSLFSVGFFIKLFIFLGIAYFVNGTPLKKHWSVILLSLMETLFLILGKQMFGFSGALDHFREVIYLGPQTMAVSYFVVHPLLWHLLATIFIFFYFWKLNSRLFDGLRPVTIKFKLPERLQNIVDSFWGKLLIIFLGQMIFFIIFYPGMIFSDTLLDWVYQSQGFRVLHYSPIYTLTTLFIAQFFIESGIVTTSVVLSIIQIILVSLIYAWALHNIQYKLTANQRLMVLLVTAFSYVLGLWSFTVNKDTLFVALLTLLMSQLYVYADRNILSQKTVYLTLFALTILRNNMVYVLILYVVVLLIRKYYRLLTPVLFSILSFFIIMTLFSRVFDYQSDGLSESSSVPLQQLIRTYHYHPESFTSEERQLMVDLVTEESFETYLPVCSDIAKRRFNLPFFQQHRNEIINLYLQKLVEHPITYLEATLANTYYLWYPESIVNVYSNEIMAQIAFQKERPEDFEKRYGRLSLEEQTNTYKDWFAFHTLDELIRHTPLRDALDWLNTQVWIERIPVVSQLFSFGNFFWLSLTVFFLSIYRRNKSVKLIFGLLMIYLFSLLFGPCILLRYIFILWVLMPLELIYLHR